MNNARPINYMAFLLFLGLMLIFNECSGKRDIGDSCKTDDQCNSGMCVGLNCVDPWTDFDGDGLPNQEERLLHTNPASPDTDGDGRPDGRELQDTDGDGVIDALESSVNDQDMDCLPDQFDPHNNTPDATSARLAKWMCNHNGVCGMGGGYIQASCMDKGTKNAKVVCDFSKVPNYNEKETLCDGLDNDCNGVTDEGFSLDGVPVGGVCQSPGVCGQGVVECMGPHTTTCSSGPKGSHYNGHTETCNHLDDNCNGITDENMTYKGLSPGQPCSGNGECGIGIVECGPDGDAICSTDPGGSNYEGKTEQCDGLDDDCNGVTDDLTDLKAMIANCPLIGVCADHSDQVMASCVNGEIQCDYSGVQGFSDGQEQWCDGLDDDCDGQTDEDFSYMEFGHGLHVGDQCGLGACNGGTVECSKDHLHAKCSGNVHASRELCNNLDDDCDGWVDEGISKNINNKFQVAWYGMPGARAYAATASLHNGIVIYGGMRSKADPTSLFDMYLVTPEHSDSQRILDLNLPKLTHPAAVTINNNILVFGNNSNGMLSVFSVPDTLDKVNGPVQIDNKSRCSGIMASYGAVDMAILYCADESSQTGRIFIVDPQSLAVTSRFTTGFITGGCMGFDRDNGMIVIVGGRNTEGRIQAKVLNIALNSGETTITDLSTQMSPIADAACVDLGAGRIFVQGGITPTSASKDTYIVSPDGNTKILPLLGGPPSLSGHFAAAWEGKIVVFDGQTKPDSVLSAWLLDIDTPSWSSLSIQPEISGGMDIVTVVNQDLGTLYVFETNGDRLSAQARFTSLVRDDGLVMDRHSVSGALPPSGANASWNSSDHKLWFFGGQDARVYKLNLTNWTFNVADVHGVQPPIRNHPLVSFSQALKGLIVFGGQQGDKQLDDCWLFKDGWLKLDRQHPVMTIQKAVWDETGHQVIAFTDDGRIMLFDAMTGLWKKSGQLSDPIKIEYALWDSYSRVALILQKGMENAVIIHFSLTGQPNINTMKMDKIQPVLSGASAFFDPFRRRFGLIGGLDAWGLPSATFITLDEVCSP